MINRIKYYLKSFTFWELLKGLSVTGRYFFKKKFTIQYPEERPYFSPYERGLHEFEPEVCIICELCAKACPVDCIYDNEDWEALYIHPEECIDCGACVPVCPVQAIFPEEELPEKWERFTQIEADWYEKRK